MGLFDQVAGMAGGLMGGGGQAAGAQGEGEATDGLGAVVRMLQDQGGVGAVLGRFQEGGLGGVVASWCGEGANAAVSADQVRSVLGSGPIAEVAQRLGVSPEAAAGHISQLLPQVMDHLTPGGRPVEGEGLGALLGGLMGRFGGARPE